VVFVNDAVLRVDPQTGAQTVVSSNTVASGLPLGRAGDIAVAPDGSLFVTLLPGFLPAQTSRLVESDGRLAAWRGRPTARSSSPIPITSAACACLSATLRSARSVFCPRRR
jgi:hypothetical protein